MGRPYGRPFQHVYLPEAWLLLLLPACAVGNRLRRYSQRQVPLVGASLWAAQRIKANASSCFAFPRYTDNSRCNANSASNALNKWLHANFRSDIVIHGFRHAMRDRLRAVSCPSEMIDQMGGWSKRSVGEGYGEGYSVLQTKQWMTRLQLNQNQGRTL